MTKLKGADESRDKDNASPTHVLADAQAHGSEQEANIIYESLHYRGACPFILETFEMPRYNESNALSADLQPSDVSPQS